MHLNNPRASFSLGYFNQQLYAIGGYNHSGLTTVEKYSIKDNHWEEIASLNYSRHGHCVISLNN